MTNEATTPNGIFHINAAPSYPERWHNQDIAYDAADSLAGIIERGHAENEAALVRAFYGQFNIRASKGFKALAAKPETTVADLTAYLQSFQIKAEKGVGGGKGNPEALAAARATREVQKVKAAKQDEMQKRAASDPKFARKLAEIEALMAEG